MWKQNYALVRSFCFGESDFEINYFVSLMLVFWFIVCFLTNCNHKYRQFCFSVNKNCSIDL